ncbi:T9SS type A sorting domain-containing protein [Flavobacterium sp.]|uniref:T9SS type A sorting domain-containing protein n=1 Tax=Flavobacterium sp. TaxID=239 RepID=UPI0040336FDD
MKRFYIALLSLLWFNHAVEAQTVLLSNDFGTDLASMQAATAGWGVAELDGNGHGWRPYLSSDFHDLGFTGIVDASASFTFDEEGDIIPLSTMNLLGSPLINLSGYSSAELTYRIGALLLDEGQMGYQLLVVEDDFIDFANPNFVESITSEGSHNVTFDLTPFTGRSITLMWYHNSTLTYGNGYLIIDDIVVTAENTAGVKEILMPKLSVYPNPATDKVTVSGLQDDTLVSIYTVSGQKVKDVVAKGDTSIDVSSLAKGMYFLNTAKGSAKIIKE